MKEKKPFVIEILVGILLVCVGSFVRSDYHPTITFSLLILSLILASIRAGTWATAMISFLFVLQWLVGVIVFRMLEKRM